MENDFKEWLMKHKNVTVEKFNNLNNVFQNEIIEVYKKSKPNQINKPTPIKETK